MIYLASPYSDPDAGTREARFTAACTAAAVLLERGKHVFSPIVHCHPIAVSHGMPGDFDYWKEYNQDMIRRCDQLVILKLEGWDSSIGVAGETWFARHLKKSIGYMNNPRSEIVVESRTAETGKPTKGENDGSRT